jgi:hypothetical protein
MSGRAWSGIVSWAAFERIPKVPHDAIAAYHDLLTDQVAADSQAHLERLQQNRHLAFGNRPLCTSLRPRFLTPQQYRFLQGAVRILMKAFARIHEAALADVAFRQQFRLLDYEEDLLGPDPGFRSPMPLSRLDAFFVSENELKFTEFNAETPAGSAFTDTLAPLVLTMPVMRAFQQNYRVIPLPTMSSVHNVLLEAYYQFSGSRELPRVAILDWREVPTYSEFVLFDEYFRSLGLHCRIVDPREVEYRNGQLCHEGYHITLIYKRVLISELLERGGMDHPVVRAVRDGAVCMVNPFRCKPLYKKASLAVLSDERQRGLFTPEELKAVDAHIPWTRVVEERHTVIDCQTVDLVPYVLQNRERFVLKPNDDYGGKGIVLGWTVDSKTWEQAVQYALATPYVVQARVRLPKEPFPSMVDGKLCITDRMLDTAPFVFGGEYMEGCLTRIATDPLLNVTAGGGSTVSTFVIESR